jgi:fructose-1-phosphate kinase PfkB-like protein
LEAEALFNYPVREMQDVYNCSQKLQEQGAKSILMEIHKTGHAMVVSPEGAWLAGIPNFDESTSSGMWEALLAAFLAARLQKKSYPEALALGVAAATFTGAQRGPEFGALKDLESEADGIEVNNIEEILQQDLHQLNNNH